MIGYFLMVIIFTTTVIGAPIMGFMILFWESCNQLNIWSKSLKIKLDSMECDPTETIQECSKFFKKGVKRTNDAFSCLLFWILTFYLIDMILSAYFSMSFLFRTSEELSYVQLLRSVEYFAGNSTIVLTIYFMNYLSDQVKNNVHELKDRISEFDSVPLMEKWEIIDKMNSFYGFDACGFFTLGKPLLTTIVASFTTFIIVLIQFKMGENTKISSCNTTTINAE